MFVPSLRHAAMLPQPVVIRGGIRWEGPAGAAFDGGAPRVSAQPSVAVDVAVSEGEVCRAVVIRARKISPHIIRPAIHEKSVVDRVGMLIEKDVDVAGRGNLGCLEKLLEL